MRCSVFLAVGFALQVAAFPRGALEEYVKRQGVPSTAAAQAASKARGNCGTVPCLTFSATEQYVSNTGEHAYASPAADQIRGPCPGLNAAANHGYLSRSGVTTIQETITGLGSLFGMSPDLAGFLAAYAVVFDGDPVTQQWSIGGPPPDDSLIKGLIGPAQGISYSHNVYEGDTSIGRQDAYLNKGDAHSLEISRFTETYKIAVDDESDRYTLDKFVQDFGRKVDYSIQNNPYYFAAPFSTTLVASAAYNFVINFMSNHSAAEPNGYLNGAMFKQWFAVSGDYPDFKWLPGQERIPDNWYRRTSSNQYNAINVFQDLAVGWAAYPNTFRLGGNTNGVNTYTGVDLGNLTNGAVHLNNLLDPTGKGAACFFTQVVQSTLPDSASIALQLQAPIANLINNYVKKTVPSGFDCPIVDKYDQTLFNRFPGYKYSPTGPATNYMKE